MMSQRGMSNPFGNDNFSSSFDAFEQELMQPEQKPPAAVSPTGFGAPGGTASPGPNAFPPFPQNPQFPANSAFPTMPGGPQTFSSGVNGPPIIPNPEMLANQTRMADMFEAPKAQSPEKPASSGGRSFFGFGGGGSSSKPAASSPDPVLPAIGGPAGFPMGTSMGGGSSSSNAAGGVPTGTMGSSGGGPQAGGPVFPGSGGGGPSGHVTSTMNNNMGGPSSSPNAATGGGGPAGFGGPNQGGPKQGQQAQHDVGSRQYGSQFESGISANQQRQRGGAQGPSESPFGQQNVQEMKNVAAEGMQAMGINNPMANIAVSAGMDAVAKQSTMIQRYLPSLDYLRCYFAVNHLYVAKKLGILLFPFKKGKIDTQAEDGHLGLRPQHNKPDGDGQQIIAMKSNVDEPELYLDFKKNEPELFRFQKK
ncbi:unnamed protein product [Amoebophrya sp. A25]|nr:unnamed protein product [Amoebophrya sp. A25]|eukprot:GSA25T00018233001.1